ncbi:hypothetical protein [Trichlorobacter lovleyi]|uniref:hypothetical protein n=1 Tax=Trichlorobacter lovleyi TaxID=313985 RepID=UPI002480554F|nr:hypothetical protein [Trichlorobacter lovleyi]
MSIELAKKLDQMAVQSSTLRQQSPELSPFLDLAESVLDSLQSENTRLFNQVAAIKQGLLTTLEAANV